MGIDHHVANQVNNNEKPSAREWVLFTRTKLPELKKDVLVAYREDPENKERLERLKKETPGAYDQVRKYCDASRKERVALVAQATTQIDALLREEDIEKIPGAIDVHYDDATKTIKNLEGQMTTVGELMADSMYWGRKYNVGSGERSRPVQLVAVVSQFLGELIDHMRSEIAFIESWMPDNNLRNGRELGVNKAYEKVSKEKEKRHTQDGKLVEDICQSFLLRIFNDHTSLGLRIVPTDPVADIKFKADFLIERRGAIPNIATEVKVDKSNAHGIQLTIDSSPETVSEKEFQIRKVKERIERGEKVPFASISLLQISLSEARGLYLRWKKAKQDSPGGPDRYLSMQSREYLFKKIVSEVVGQEEATKMWENVRAQEEEMVKRFS